MKGTLIVFGLLSLAVYVLNIVYYFINRRLCPANSSLCKPSLNKRLNIKTHCMLGVLTLIFALIHIYDKLASIGIKSGYVSLFFLLLLNFSGFFRKYPKSKDLNSKWCKTIHFAFTIGFMISIIYHIIEKI